jgi:peptide/nickel transport system substrate-binding protein
VAGAFPEGVARPARSLVSPAVFGFSPEHRRNGVDLDLARQLLREAGVRDGTPLRLEYPGLYNDVAPLVQNAFDQIGLIAVPDELPFEAFYRRLEEAANQMFIFRWNFTVADASPFLDAIVHSRDPVRGLGILNGAALSDPVLDDAIERAAHEPRSDIRLQRLQDVLQQVSDHYVYLPLFHPSVTTLIREPFILDNRQVRPQDVHLRQ